MGAMTITEFKSHLDDAFARVEAGEIIEITQNDRIIIEVRRRRVPDKAEWEESSKKMTEILSRGFHLGGGPFTEDEKYGDAPL